MAAQNCTECRCACTLTLCLPKPEIQFRVTLENLQSKKYNNQQARPLYDNLEK